MEINSINNSLGANHIKPEETRVARTDDKAKSKNQIESVPATLSSEGKELAKKNELSVQITPSSSQSTENNQQPENSNSSEEPRAIEKTTTNQRGISIYESIQNIEDV